ncbi:MAG TPA: four helix bundle protein [bacterium]|nr:four helix bundle protein [bacterium]
MLEVKGPGKEISGRLLDFATNVLALSNRMGRTASGRYLANQLVRAACSAGANYQESRGAESRADFVHKMHIVLKELREAHYWLTLVERSRLVTGECVTSLVGEANELVSILVRALVTAKSRGATSDI